MPLICYKAFANIKTLLSTAIGLDSKSSKHIAEATGIKADTLYKWKSTSVLLSPEKADRLLVYFIEKEPKRLKRAKLLQALIYNYYLSDSPLAFNK